MLDENRNLHFATTADRENFRVAGLSDAERDVGANFFDEAIPNVARGDELAVLTGERPVVHGEFHLNGGRINRDIGQRGAEFGIANRLADEHVLETREADDVAGVRFRDLDALHAFEMVDHRDLALGNFAVAVAANRRISDLHFAFDNFAECDTPDVFVVIQVGHEQLKTFAGLGTRRRNVFHDRVEQRLHRAAGVFEFHFRVAGLGRGVDEREIQLLVRRVERHEQFKHEVENFFWVGVLAVNLIDDDNRLRAGLERLAQHEARLRLRAFG